MIEAIKRLEVTKNNLEKKVIDEKSKHLTLLESAYLSILSINEEQANTHFQSLDDDVPFATKVENSTNSMVI